MLKAIVCFSLLFSTMLLARSQATQPGGSSAMEIRANEEFNRGNWSAALPLLKKAAEQLRATNQTDRLGPIEESIRVCEKNLKAASGAAPAKQPAGANATDDSRTPHPEPKPGEVIELTIQGLGNFDYDAEQGGNIPADVKRLSGATIRLRGFMIPMDQADSITQFALVPSLFACCFGQPPQVQHTIVVHVPKGKAVGYYADEIVVEGKLLVDEKKDDDFIVSIFEMDSISVKPASK